MQLPVFGDTTVAAKESVKWMNQQETSKYEMQKNYLFHSVVTTSANSKSSALGP